MPVHPAGPALGGGVGRPPLRDHLWQGPPLPVTLRLIHDPGVMTPLAKIAIFGHPPLQILPPPQERSHSIAIFAFFFRYFSPLDQTNFSRFRRTLSTGFDCWLCYFRYFAIGEVRGYIETVWGRGYVLRELSEGQARISGR